MYERPGYRTLLGRVRDNVRLYIRKQLELPRQEIAEIVAANLRAAMWFGVALAFVLCTFVALTVTIIAVIAIWLPFPVAALITLLISWHCGPHGLHRFTRTRAAGAHAVHQSLKRRCVGRKPVCSDGARASGPSRDLDVDLSELRTRLREDVDPRTIVRRQQLAAVRGARSVAGVGSVTVAKGLRERKLRRAADTDLEAVIARLGGRVDKLRGKARKRLRETLRKEIADVEQPPKAEQMIWQSASGALTAALTLVAQRFASRLLGDEELPKET